MSLEHIVVLLAVPQEAVKLSFKSEMQVAGRVPQPLPLSAADFISDAVEMKMCRQMCHESCIGTGKPFDIRDSGALNVNDVRTVVLFCTIVSFMATSLATVRYTLWPPPLLLTPGKGCDQSYPNKLADEVATGAVAAAETFGHAMSIMFGVSIKNSPLF